MAKKFHSTLLFLLFIVNTVIGQEILPNLIPNPSFEDVNTCIKYKEACFPEAWRSTTLKAFYYVDATKNRRSPNSAFDGQRYISLCMYNTKRAYDRSFLQTPLLCELQAGQQYEFSFYYKAPLQMLATFGAYFTDTLEIRTNNESLKTITPTFNFHNINQKVDPKWILVKDTFTAKGGENVLIIGNFASDEQTQIATVLKTKKKKRSYDNKKTRVYYHFDQFNLSPLNGPLDCDIEKNKALLYADDVRHNRSIRPATINKAISIEKPKILDPELIISKPEILVIGTDSIILSESHFELPNILFDFNSDRLLPIAYPSLRKLSSFLITHREFKISVTGHTDGDGTQGFNQNLSEKRAKAVHDYLMRQGISKSRITYFGKGESMPIDSNDTEEGKSRNRRVAFKLIKN